MSAREIDDYLGNLGESKRTTLQKLRQTILSIVPEAEQGIAYGSPAFRMHGKVVAGFAAFKNHLSYLPHSGSVFKQIPEDVARYHTSSGALQFPIDKPLPKALVKRLIDLRLKELLER
jgi:uncharacterized protein YdhG (YjbR/CyaY superfamily)